MEYRPAKSDDGEKQTGAIDLEKISSESRKIFEGEESSILPSLLKLGGSPGGARPKILVSLQESKSGGITIRSDDDNPPSGFSHWLIKFIGKGDEAHDSLIEFQYMQAARNAGLSVPEHKLFGEGKNKYFGVRRFDRGINNEKLHVHSLAGLMHSDFRTPAFDYKDLLKVAVLLTAMYSERDMAFRLAVFNVIFHNRDDHSKNFS
ncbi:MAG: type II toxin-antitoxin system HipA family toxin, partial [Proteobacteria bacterium]